MDESMSRRALLAAGIAVTAGVAGCNDDAEPTDVGTAPRTETATAARTDVPTETPTAVPTDVSTAVLTETPRDSPTVTPARTVEPADRDGTPSGEKPSLSEFRYPNGVDESGVDDKILLSMHKDTMETSDSFSVTAVTDLRLGDTPIYWLESTDFVADTGYFRELDNRDRSVVANMWAPADEPKGPDHVTYVQAFNGPDQTYRIDQHQLSRRMIWGESDIRDVVSGIEWSDAQEIVAVGDKWGVTYESVGVRDADTVAHRSELHEFTAEMTVVAGPRKIPDTYISDITYTVEKTNSNDIREEWDRSIAVGNFGSVSVRRPDWFDHARRDAYYFKDARRTDNNRAFIVQMANGGALPTDAEIALSDADGRAVANPPREVGVGDRLYVGFSTGGELLVGVNEFPDGTRKLTDKGSANFKIRDGAVAFEHDEGPLGSLL